MKKLKYIVIVIPLIFYSCSSVSTKDDYESKIIKLSQELNSDSTNYDALKDLAVVMVRAGKNEEAVPLLKKALDFNPLDPAVLFHTGLNYEMLNDIPEAVKYYSRYKELPGESSYKELMYGRYLVLNKKMVNEEIKRLIRAEQTLSTAQLSKDTLAVFPLAFTGTDIDFVPLGRGFSEMISIDLAKVKKLTVLERVRLEALKDELKLSQSPQMDQSTAPRVGKLLRAGLIYTGSFNVIDNSELTMNLASWDVKTGEAVDAVGKSGNVQYLFQIEKELVFQIIENLGIELTREQRENIEFIPTENLQAFLAYSQGLIFEDACMYENAASYFESAVESDPNFTEAKIKLESAVSSESASGSTTELAGVAAAMDPVEIIKTTVPVNERLEAISENIKSNFLPGIDNRNPAEEESGSAATSSLPPPPPPPASSINK